jgi:hypothetical protein
VFNCSHPLFLDGEKTSGLIFRNRCAAKSSRLQLTATRVKKALV